MGGIVHSRRLFFPFGSTRYAETSGSSLDWGRFEHRDSACCSAIDPTTTTTDTTFRRHVLLLKPSHRSCLLFYLLFTTHSTTATTHDSSLSCMPCPPLTLPLQHPYLDAYLSNIPLSFGDVTGYLKSSSTAAHHLISSMLSIYLSKANERALKHPSPKQKRKNKVQGWIPEF